jgi:hypothetical protein
VTFATPALPRADGPPLMHPDVLNPAREAQARAAPLADDLPARWDDHTVATDGITVVNGYAQEQPPGFTGRAGVLTGPAMVDHTRAIGQPVPGHFAGRGMLRAPPPGHPFRQPDMDTRESHGRYDGRLGRMFC